MQVDRNLHRWAHSMTGEQADGHRRTHTAIVEIQKQRRIILRKRGDGMQSRRGKEDDHQNVCKISLYSFDIFNICLPTRGLCITSSK